MLKKCAILGLAVLLVGGLALGWLLNETRSEQKQTSELKAKHTLQGEDYLTRYSQWPLLSPEEQNQLVLEMNEDGKTKSRQQLAEEQRTRLQVDMEKLAAGETNSGEIADLLYGAGWEEQVREYKKHQEQKEIAHTASVVCISIGGIILGGCIVIWLLWGLVRLVRAIRAWRRRSKKETQALPQTEELTEIEAQTAAATEDPAPGTSRAYGESETCRPQSTLGVEPGGFLPRTLGVHPSSRRATLTARKAVLEEDPVDLLMSDEPLTEIWSPDAQWAACTAPEVSCEEVMQAPQFNPRSGVATLAPDHRASEHAASLKEQADDLQKQLAEFKEMAQSVKQASQGQSEPLGSTLKELAQQVSAIREYAASQQNRVEKLQDGYDWGIIRTFCLRVIRCIDNVEKRIEDLGEEDEATASLEEIRDELLFALESSGVERYEPQVNDDYRGQEKLAEAVTSRQASNNPEQAGKIAKVLRPGYRYIIDDENWKVVRTAQVKLFG